MATYSDEHENREERSPLAPEDELVRLMRSLDPARTPLDYADSARGQEILHRILSGEAEEVIPVGAPARKSLRRPLLAAAAIAALAAILVVVPVTMPGGEPPPAAAAAVPLPLELSEPPGSTAESLALVNEALARSGGPVEALRESTMLGWWVKMDGGSMKIEPGPITTQLVQTRWYEDLSGRIVMSVGESYYADRPGEPVLTEGAPAAGTVLHDVRFAPGEFDTAVPFIVGDSVADMRAVLAAEGLENDADAARTIDVISGLLSDWTLTNSQQRALFDILQDKGGIEVAGETRDRAGRDVIAFRTVTSDGHFERLLLASIQTGRVLGLETIRVRPIGNIPAGTVISYTLWEVNP